MKFGTLLGFFTVLGFVGLLQAGPALAAYGDTRTAGSQPPSLDISASAIREQVMRAYQDEQPGSRNGVRLASAAPTGTQLLPDELDLPADLSQARAAQVMVYKSERRMDILDSRGRAIRSYQVSLGKTPVGSKERQGDNKTPEGRYTIDWRNPQSAYHLSLRISYPSKADKWRANKQGVNPGGDIFIHGAPNGQGWKKWKYNKSRDWTNGCIAVSDTEIREIWNLVPDGTPIIIKP
jgi:lipoprotein-anchoring transpeptidase ErfK/SrfK